MYLHSAPLSDNFQKFKNFFNAVINQIIQKMLCFYIAGHFDLLKYINGTETNSYGDILLSNSCENLIDKPICITASLATIFDHIMTNVIKHDVHSVPALYRIRIVKIVRPACRKKRLLTTHQSQSALLMAGLPVSNLHS